MALFGDRARRAPPLAHDTTRRALLMTVLGAVLGIIIVFISCARGAFASVAPLKLMLAMLLWAFATLMISESAEGD